MLLFTTSQHEFFPLSETGAKKKVVVNIECDLDSSDPQLTFERRDKLSTEFKVKTALACPPKVVDCVVQVGVGRMGAGREVLSYHGDQLFKAIMLDRDILSRANDF